MRFVLFVLLTMMGCPEPQLGRPFPTTTDPGVSGQCPGTFGAARFGDACFGK